MDTQLVQSQLAYTSSSVMEDSRFGVMLLRDARTLASLIFSLRGIVLFWCLTGAEAAVNAGKWGQFIGARLALSSTKTYIGAIPRHTVVGQAL